MSRGVGLKVLLRLRLSAHDAHYGGGLVDGARCLGLFGDVATELCIRLDGDEGLFRAYESVEFLAPLEPGAGVRATRAFVRERSPRLKDDRSLAPDIEAVALAIRAGELEEAVA